MNASYFLNEYTDRYPLYECFPAVVKVGERVTVSIVPEGSCRFFREDKEYELWIGAMTDDMSDYYPRPEPNTDCHAKNGYLVFECVFGRESEYSVRFRERGGEYTETSVYAVREDLFNLRPLKGNFHTHSMYSDGKDDVALTAARYREEGYDFYTLTDHNRYFTSVMAAEAYEGVNLGMCIVRGEEVHTPGSNLHFVHAGGSQSVDEIYINDRARFDAEVARIAKTLGNVPARYRQRMAEAVWGCEKAHEAGGIAIFAHPFWRSNIYNISEEFCDLLFDANIFDAFELVGGESFGVNLQLGLWQKQLLKGNDISVVGSDDCHNDGFKMLGRKFSVVFAKENTEEAVIDAVRNKMSVACEFDGDMLRCYGDARLVMFTHFLDAHYFGATKRMFAGEGNLMRRYIREETGKEPLNALADEGDKFYARFYGRVPPVSVSQKRMSFYEKWREVQKNKGPKTCGSQLQIFPGRNNYARY